MADMTYPGSSLASLFNRHHTVGEDLSVEPDPDLHSYQDDFDHIKTTLGAPASEVLEAGTEDDEDDDLINHDE